MTCTARQYVRFLPCWQPATAWAFQPRIFEMIRWERGAAKLRGVCGLGWRVGKQRDRHMLKDLRQGEPPCRWGPRGGERFPCQHVMPVQRGCRREEQGVRPP